MAQVLCPATAVDLPIITDGNAYQAQWTKAKSDAIIDTSGLPSQGHALYLLSTVDFHIGHVFHLYDSEELAKALQDFYGDIEHKAESSKLWYIQFLVIMAFGETFLLPPTRSKQPPVCSPYFTRAMSFLPDLSEMWNDPILSIEVLALVALYLYSLDMRDSSCCYVCLQFSNEEVGPSIDLRIQIGQAMRMALIEGLHRPLPIELEPRLADRWTNIWWTVYILDNKFSASVGIPSSVRDETVAARLWDPMRCDKEKIGISLHVKVTQVISRVLSCMICFGGNMILWVC